MAAIRSRLAVLALFTVLMTLLLAGRGFAQQPPGIPWIVSGTVTLNGSAAPDGLNVTAWDNGAIVGSALTSGGNYSVNICGSAGQVCHSGDTVTFQLAQLKDTTDTFALTSSNEGFPSTLNLSFTGTPSQVSPQQTTTAASTSITQTTSAVAEYPNSILIPLVALMITLGAVTTLHRRKQ